MEQAGKSSTMSSMQQYSPKPVHPGPPHSSHVVGQHASPLSDSIPAMSPAPGHTSGGGDTNEYGQKSETNLNDMANLW